MFIAERYQNIKDTDEYPMTNELLETLDQLLDQFNVNTFSPWDIRQTLTKTPMWYTA